MDGEDLRALLINGQETIQVHFGQKDFLQTIPQFSRSAPGNSKIEW